MKLKPRSTIINLSVYPFDLLVSFNEKDDEVFNKLNELGANVEMSDIETKTTQAGKSILFSTNHSLIRIPIFTGTPNDYGVLAHEIFHIAEFVLNRVGITHSSDSNESFAYLIQYITKEIYKEFNLK
jgi:hypothetical protein